MFLHVFFVKFLLTTLELITKTVLEHLQQSFDNFFLIRVCLVHFAKMCKDVNRAFEVLNEVYLQNFLHRWVVNRETNLMMLINL